MPNHASAVPAVLTPRRPPPGHGKGPRGWGLPGACHCRCKTGAPKARIFDNDEKVLGTPLSEVLGTPRVQDYVDWLNLVCPHFGGQNAQTGQVLAPICPPNGGQRVVSRGRTLKASSRAGFGGCPQQQSRSPTSSRTCGSGRALSGRCLPSRRERAARSPLASATGASPSRRRESRRVPGPPAHKARGRSVPPDRSDPACPPC